MKKLLSAVVRAQWANSGGEVSITSLKSINSANNPPNHHKTYHHQPLIPPPTTKPPQLTQKSQPLQ